MENVPSWRESALMVVPFVGGVVARRSSDGLVALRGLFLGFCGALFLVAVAVAVLAGFGDLPGSGVNEAAVALVVVVVGVSGITASLLSSRRLTCGDDAAIAGAYRSRFFLRIAFSQAASLIGFAGFIVTDDPAVFIPGAVLSALGYAHAAPTAAKLRRDQEQLRIDGCGVDLVDALRRNPRSRDRQGC